MLIYKFKYKNYIISIDKNINLYNDKYIYDLEINILYYLYI